MGGRQEHVAESERWRVFRRRVDEKIAADLRREDEAGEVLRDALCARLRGVILALRDKGQLGRAWLFGSFAWETPRESSDVDLLVEGWQDLDAIAAAVEAGCGRPVHLLSIERAPKSLRQRVLAEGVEF